MLWQVMLMACVSGMVVAHAVVKALLGALCACLQGCSLQITKQDVG